MNTLGKRIQKLRENVNMTQKELALKVDLNVSVMNRIELDDRPARDDEIIKIADALGVTTDYLLGVSDRRSTDTPYYINEDTAELAQEIFDNPELKILMSASRKLEKEDIEALVSIVQRMKGE